MEKKIEKSKSLKFDDIDSKLKIESLTRQLHKVLFKCNEEGENLMTFLIHYLHQVQTIPNLLDWFYDNHIDPNRGKNREYILQGRLFMKLLIDDDEYNIHINEESLPKINFNSVSDDEEFKNIAQELSVFFKDIKNDAADITSIVENIFKQEHASAKLFDTFKPTQLELFWQSVNLKNDFDKGKRIALEGFVQKAMYFPIEQILADPIFSTIAKEQVYFDSILLTKEGNKTSLAWEQLLKKQAKERKILEKKHIHERNVFRKEHNISHKNIHDNSSSESLSKESTPRLMFGDMDSKTKIESLTRQLHRVLFKCNEDDENLMTFFISYLHQVQSIPNLLDWIYDNYIDSNSDKNRKNFLQGKLFMKLLIDDDEYNIHINEESLPKINFNSISDDEDFKNITQELSVFFKDNKNDDVDITSIVKNIFKQEHASAKLFDNFNPTQLELFWQSVNLKNDFDKGKRIALEKFVLKAMYFPIEQILADPIFSIIAREQVSSNSILQTNEGNKTSLEWEQLLKQQDKERKIMEKKHIHERNAFRKEHNLLYKNKHDNSSSESLSKESLPQKIPNNAKDASKSFKRRNLKYFSSSGGGSGVSGSPTGISLGSGLSSSSGEASSHSNRKLSY